MTERLQLTTSKAHLGTNLREEVLHETVRIKVLLMIDCYRIHIAEFQTIR